VSNPGFVFFFFFDSIFVSLSVVCHLSFEFTRWQFGSESKHEEVLGSIADQKEIVDWW
jgi:hypothetical protein